MYFFKQASKAVLVAVISVFPVSAQSVQIKAVKETTAVPKACESIVRTNIEGQVDIKALVKEASCKGSGDMMTEYTYVLKSVKREKRNKGQTKEETRVYEVFMPSLQSGTRGNGVVLLRNMALRHVAFHLVRAFDACHGVLKVVLLAILWQHRNERHHLLVGHYAHLRAAIAAGAVRPHVFHVL